MNLPEKRETAARLTNEEIEEAREVISLEWEVQEDKLIKRVYKFSDFKKGLNFTHAIGLISEEMNHHPDIQLSWGKVVVKTTTHSVGGLSSNDFALAERFDAEYATFV